MPFAPIIQNHHGKPCPYCRQIMRVDAKSQRCGKPMKHNFPTREHVIPKSRMAGMGTIIVCNKCNWDKKSLMLREWHVVLVERKDPRAPIVEEFMRINWFRELDTHGRPYKPSQDGGTLFLRKQEE